MLTIWIYAMYFYVFSPTLGYNIMKYASAYINKYTLNVTISLIKSY